MNLFEILLVCHNNSYDSVQRGKFLADIGVMPAVQGHINCCFNDDGKLQTDAGETVVVTPKKSGW